MQKKTVEFLSCPRLKKGKEPCRSGLMLLPKHTLAGQDIWTGVLQCKKCQFQFPILHGIAILVHDVHGYVVSHAKGISKLVTDEEIQKDYRADFIEAKEFYEPEHIEEDLESERVNALYLMTHYLSANAEDKNKGWWKARSGTSSPLIDSLVKEYWDRGPFFEINQLFEKNFKTPMSVVELGCGVGGLLRSIGSKCKSYLGVDSSFASIALARHINLGAAYPAKTKIPEDLLQGTASFEVELGTSELFGDDFDFIVGEAENLPLQAAQWDVSIALNMIDMMDEPEVLPRIQLELVRKDGYAIESCPYIWHEKVAKRMRAKLVHGRVGEIRDSAAAVSWLYQQTGFKIITSQEHVPWLFLKHPRQLEIYSVHLFLAQVD